MTKINEIFTEEVQEHYKNNKDLITGELLNELREHGNEGKQIALNILDLFQDEEAYYLDAFNNRISYDGDRSLKKPYTKLELAPIHKEEISKCSDDIFYYMNNYVKIKTPKGINFIDTRPYQNDFLDVIIPDENESIVSLQPRQCCSSTTTIDVINNHKSENLTFEELFNECKEEVLHKEAKSVESI